MSAIYCATRSSVDLLVAVLPNGLRAELNLTPKPGLVDRWDSGAHDDLNYPLMQHSINLLQHYFQNCAAALQLGYTLEILRTLGLAAQRRMLQTLGTNTHSGAIFLGGLLLGAVHMADSTADEAVSIAAAEAAHQLFSRQLPRHTKGAQMRERYGVGGIVHEALNGLPALFTVAVPTLREAQKMGFAKREALFLAMARLMQIVEDTTSLKRCGRAGLEQLHKDGCLLEALILSRVDPTEFLSRANQSYRSCGLTMGGVADVLGLSAAWIEFKSI